MSEPRFASWISVPTSDVGSVVAALKARQERSTHAKVLDLASEGRVVAFALSGHTFVVGPEMGMGAAAAQTSRRFGSALSFHFDPKRGVVLATHYEGGRPTRSVSEIQSELDVTGQPLPGEMEHAAPLTFAKVAALSRSWGSEPVDASTEVDVVVITTTHDRRERLRRPLAIGLAVLILAALAFAFALTPSAEERCVARCESMSRATYDGSVDCPGGLATCAPYLDAVAACPAMCQGR